ncbi:MAG TPA: hypothetical protein VKH42_11115, partial [Vicinamibacterales bacterium]|nr:hypothetical protein [Vicinamibacterales bacterium]
MRRSRHVSSISLCFCLLTLPCLAAQDGPQPPRPVVRDISIEGARELGRSWVVRGGHVTLGEPLPAGPDHIAQDIERRYHEAGYAFAVVTATFDDDTGTLSLVVDEGVIDAVEFQGIGPRVAHTLADEFALRAGDVFNRSRATQALNAVLRPTRGAIQPVGRRRTFNLIDRDGQRVLIVDLREPAGRFKLIPDLGDREDWFTPVDGFVPSLGFGAAVFDHEDFNHAFVAGHLSFKFASSDVGYAVGFEKPFFVAPKLFVGGEIHDLTASDDQWQLSATEASLASIGPRLNFRDYYRRRGVQVNSGLRVDSRVEVLVSYRNERHEPLPIESDFSVWNNDERFRPNRIAAPGRLSAFVLGVSVDGDGFDKESLESGFRRHQ